MHFELVMKRSVYTFGGFPFSPVRQINVYSLRNPSATVNDFPHRYATYNGFSLCGYYYLKRVSVDSTYLPDAAPCAPIPIIA